MILSMGLWKDLKASWAKARADEQAYCRANAKRCVDDILDHVQRGWRGPGGWSIGPFEAYEIARRINEAKNSNK